MTSLCLQIANAILRTHMVDMAELTRRAIEEDGLFSLRSGLHDREKEVIFRNTIAGLSMITSIAWQLRENELVTFHQLSTELKKFSESGVLPPLFNAEVSVCQDN
ncbi:hypothetical protein [Yersinia aleksiciae]|uniref:Uncharacterized protein n=1 Tax=Yersinia aleksiciae TaxID=263819 RepID=A0ABM5U8K1_YERAE|nr:hypothetical protein [Yersinia aleksiciae]AKP32139.1 hypothetical protein ACZ76_00500 [Yersinia aleksiciae]CFQ34303.1 Uncharacterised protein [Yersinia aleksiciae]